MQNFVQYKQTRWKGKSKVKTRGSLFLLFKTHGLACPIRVIECCVHFKQEQSGHAPNCIGMNELIGRTHKLLVWYRRCECHGSSITCTARVHHEYVTNTWSINHGPTSNITTVSVDKDTSEIGIL